MDGKIKVEHLGRMAAVYVRQSSPGQVRNNLEGQRLQYAMKNRIADLGWSAKSIQIIDEDLGITANGATEREGFERLIGQVACGRIGLVGAREVSRLARNNVDWQRLLEYCRLNDTLVMDNETVYDMRVPNDRLLLGIKGDISSYELDIIRARALDAKREKAQRGELSFAVPTGYVRAPDGRMEITPDQQVREAVTLVFDKFLELGTAWRTVRWFRDAGLLLPGCRHSPDGTRIQWKAPRLGRVLRFLKNPMYAGVYVFGRSKTGKEQRANMARPATDHIRDPKAWPVVIHDRHEGYIDVETFKRIHRMLDNNTQKFAGLRGAGGAARNGQGLLSGLLRCVRCGRLMLVVYDSRNKRPRYVCFHGDGSALPKCDFYFSGSKPDEVITQAILQVVTPMTVEAAEQAFLEHNAVEDEREKALSRECERTRYEAERAWRQYDAIEPENRLVAVSLERRWNQALERQREAEDRLAAVRAEVGREKRSREDFLAMAAAFPDIWRSPSTDFSLKKRIVRALIEEVATEEVSPSEILLRVHWRGGNHTEHRFPRLRKGEGERRHPVEAVTAITQLSVLCNDRLTAKYLSQNHIPRAGGATGWKYYHVISVRKRRGIPAYSKSERQRTGFMTLTEASAFLGISADGLQTLAVRGEVAYEHPLPIGPYIFRRADLEGQNGDRLRALVRGRLKRKVEESLIDGGLFDEMENSGDHSRSPVDSTR